MAILILLSISAVSAAELDDGSDSLAADNNPEIIKADGDIGNFTELNNYLNREINAGNYEISLNKSYKYAAGESFANNEIRINHMNHAVTILGNNHIIDADNNNIKIRTLTYENAVVLKDIAFINAKSGNGAIQATNPNLVINNCTFENNSGRYGGAMYIVADNAQVINCTFRNNNGTFGGALYVQSNNLNISGSTFENNKAVTRGGAVDIVNSNNATVLSSVFNNNTVENKNRASNGGGAIRFASGSNFKVINSKFNDNVGGGSGGAIYVTGTDIFSKNITIDSCSFKGDKAYVEGGAIDFSYSDNLTVKNCNFTKCEVTNIDLDFPGGSYGGAIRGASHTSNLIVSDCIFDSNTAHLNAGGAIEYYGVNISVGNTDFKNNTAHSDGGALYIHSVGIVNFTGCNFTGNKIIKGNINLIGPYSGGAMLIRKNPSNIDAAGVNPDPLETHITDCNFVDNVAPGFGGALCIRTDSYNSNHYHDYKHNATIDGCYFDGNNATVGSAIYIYKTCYVNISNTEFGENRANSSSIQPMIEKDGVNHTDNNVKFYYSSDVPAHVNFTAWDNIANAIWNSAFTQRANPIDLTTDKIEDISGDVEQVKLKNVTFDIYRNGAVEKMITPDSYVTPKEGHAKSNNGDDVWQDILENNQLILLTLVNDDDQIIVYENERYTTDIPGNITRVFKNLKPGNYTLKASHPRDVYYTEISNSISFEILKVNSTVNGTNDTKIYNQPVNVKVSSQNATNVTYVVFDKENHIVDQGTGTLGPNGEFTLTGLPVGNYTVNLTTVVEEYYNVAHNQSYIKVLPAPSTVEGENQNVTYGDPIVVPVTSENATGVTYEIIKDGKVISEGTVVDGVIDLTGLDLPVGEYTVNLTASVDGNHIPSNNTCKVTVNPAPSVVEGEDQNVTYGDPIVVPVTSENATGVTYEIIKDGKVISEGTVVDGVIDLTGLDLPVGEYTVNLTASVDGNHIPSNNTCKVTVNPAPSVVEGEDQNVTYGDPIVVPVTSENATEIIYQIIDENGTVIKTGTINPGESITGVVLPVGNYTVNLTTVVDGNHIKNYNQSSITVNPAPSVVSGTDVNVTYGDPIVVPYESTNATEVIYEIFDEDGNLVVNGTVGPDGTVPVDQMPVGNYTVNWTTVVDGNHTPATNTSIITVNPAPSVVSGTDVNVTYGDEIVVPYESTNATEVIYEIFDEDGNLVVNGTVGPDGTVPVDQLPVGNYTVNWTTVVDGNHTPATNTSIITVNPAPSVVEVENVTVTYGDPIVVPYESTNATEVIYEIFDEDGNLVVNGTVGPDGTVPVDQLPVGNYTVNWTTVVDGNHTPATNTSIITVNPAPSAVEGENVTVYYGDPIAVPYESTNATAVSYEIFDEDGNLVVNGTVGPDGTIDLEKLPVGNYTVSWTTIVDDNHISVTNTSSVEVSPIPTKVTIGNITAYPGENVTIPINVTILNGEPFTGEVAVIMPDNSTQIVSVTNGTGILTWYVPDDYAPDKYSDSIRFPGSDIYLPSNGTGIVEVVKVPTQIEVGNVTAFAGTEVTIPINVTADDGKPFNGNVTIALPDGSTKVVETVNGQGSVDWFVPYDYTPNKYPDTVKFAGDNKYLPSEGKGTITVVKIPVDIIVDNVITKPGELVTIPIKVIPRDGSVFNGKVTVKLPDGSEKVIDIVDGEGSVDWNVPDNYRGVFSVKVVFDGNEVYYPANGTGFVTVIPDELPEENKTSTPIEKLPKDSLARYETGNPIIALLAVLALLGVGIKRRK